MTPARIDSMNLHRPDHGRAQSNAHAYVNAATRSLVADSARTRVLEHERDVERETECERAVALFIGARGRNRGIRIQNEHSRV